MKQYTEHCWKVILEHLATPSKNILTKHPFTLSILEEINSSCVLCIFQILQIKLTQTQLCVCVQSKQATGFHNTSFLTSPFTDKI